MEREYESSHPWITFRFDPNKLSAIDWVHVGEALSKCDHIAGTPLTPATRDRLHRVYLAKGVAATTQIEGNSLSEEQVERRIEGDLKLPESQEYLGQEVDNIIEACERILRDLADGSDMSVTPGRVNYFNEIVLKGLPPEEGVVPGKTRVSVVVGNVYRGAPARDVDYLLGRLSEWLDELGAVDEPWRRPMRLIRAILAHLYLAWIHPYGNGNGRTARLVEFQLLLGAGLPTPACHLLSNYYNKTRQRYYETLRKTSQPPYTVEAFVAYALRGFVEELREQLVDIRGQQIAVAWINFIHEVLPGGSVATRRQRELMLTLAPNVFTPTADIRRLTVGLAEQYLNKGQKTISRDVNTLVNLGLLQRGRTGVRPRTELILAFLPLANTDE